MERREGLTIAKAKEIDLVNYMASLGLQPTRISGHNYWYLSPFPDRNERTASVKVDKNRNTWKDFGDGRGGSIIDFVMYYYQCNISNALNILSGQTYSVQPFIKPDIPDDPASHTKVIADRVINHPWLVKYLHDRRISLHIANQYCREVDFTLYNKQYVAIGFKNNFGGWELRNKYFKGASSPKDVSHIDNCAGRLKVFEGFIDFLSHQMIYQKQECAPSNFLILNTLSFIERAKNIMENYPIVHLYLDRDDRGIGATEQLLQSNFRYKDESHLYHQYKDLNEMLVTIGQTNKQNPQCKFKL